MTDKQAKKIGTAMAWKMDAIPWLAGIERVIHAYELLMACKELTDDQHQHLREAQELRQSIRTQLMVIRELYG